MVLQVAYLEHLTLCLQSKNPSLPPDERKLQVTVGGLFPVLEFKVLNGAGGVLAPATWAESRGGVISVNLKPITATTGYKVGVLTIGMVILFRLTK
jgi:hypothetical protein